MDEVFEPRLLVECKVEPSSFGSTYHKAFAEPVYLDHGDGERVKTFSGGWGYPQRELYRLAVTAQADEVTTAFYAHQVVYRDVYSVDLDEAERMTKLLRKITKGLDRLQAKYGYPEDFAAYLIRVGDVLGVTSFGYRVEGGSRSDLLGTGARWTDAAGIQSHIHHTEREFASNYGKEQRSA